MEILSHSSSSAPGLKIFGTSLRKRATQYRGYFTTHEYTLRVLIGDTHDSTALPSRCLVITKIIMIIILIMIIVIMKIDDNINNEINNNRYIKKYKFR